MADADIIVEFGTWIDHSSVGYDCWHGLLPGLFFDLELDAFWIAFIAITLRSSLLGFLVIGRCREKESLSDFGSALVRKVHWQVRH